jgi:Kef-type K+ transport system membrane component KefB
MSGILHLIEFQMSFLLFVALAGYLIAARVNQSAVIGEILLGLVVGPSVLGLVTYTDFVAGIAHLGAIFLLFVVGMEFKLEDIARPRYLLIATCGVFVPWAMGYGTSLLFGFPSGESLFIAAALTATSIAITANILKEMGKLGSAAARAIIGAAVIDDVLALLVLGVTNGLAAGALSLPAVALLGGKAILFLVVGAAAGHWGLRPLLSVVDGAAFTRRFPEITFLLATMLAFLYAAAAELTGLSAIVGAFIAGASMGGVRFRQGKDLQAGTEYLQIIFSSIFFVSLGILADVKAVQAHTLLFLVAITAVAYASKLLGCGGAALATRSSWRESLVIGMGMAPRGEVAMIVALIGLNKGLISQEIYVAIILMSLLTTVATPVALKRLLASPAARGRRRLA